MFEIVNEQAAGPVIRVIGVGGAGGNANEVTIQGTAARDLFEIDHCAAGAALADEWNFPEPIVVAIARHHDEPPRRATTLYSFVQVCWRLADTLGFAAFPPDRPWSYEELIETIPAQRASWLTAGLSAVEGEIGSRLSNLRL